MLCQKETIIYFIIKIALLMMEKLVCIKNNLTNIDISKNTALRYLYCNDNQLTSIDVRGCEKLKNFEHDDVLVTA